MPTIEPFYEELGRLIQLKRNKQGMTQEKLGLLLDPPMTRASIANIETGKQRVMAHTFVQLAERLGAKLSELIPSEQQKQPASANLEAELSQKLDLSKTQIKKLTAQLANQSQRRRR